MKKSDLKPNKETQEEELKRLRKENAKLKSQKEANKTKTSERSKELKKSSWRESGHFTQCQIDTKKLRIKTKTSKSNMWVDFL